MAYPLIESDRVYMKHGIIQSDASQMVQGVDLTYEVGQRDLGMFALGVIQKRWGDLGQFLMAQGD